MDLVQDTCRFLVYVQAKCLTHKLQLVVIEALVSEQLLQKCHDLAGAILVHLWQVDVAQIQHQLARVLYADVKTITI